MKEGYGARQERERRRREAEERARAVRVTRRERERARAEAEAEAEAVTESARARSCYSGSTYLGTLEMRFPGDFESISTSANCRFACHDLSLFLMQAVQARERREGITLPPEDAGRWCEPGLLLEQCVTSFPLMSTLAISPSRQIAPGPVSNVLSSMTRSECDCAGARESGNSLVQIGAAKRFSWHTSLTLLFLKRTVWAYSPSGVDCLAAVPTWGGLAAGRAWLCLSLGALHKQTGRYKAADPGQS